MKKVLIGCALVSMLLCFITSPASAQAKGKCVEMFFDWSGTYTGYGSTTIWFDNNGTFQSIAGYTGVWYDNSGARVWIYDDAPHTFYAGKKTMGFMRNDATVWGGLPGVWYTKGTKKSNCDFIYAQSSIQTLRDSGENGSSIDQVK